MKTIILPGYSINNKKWAFEVKEFLDKHSLEANVYEWRHWQGGKMNISREVEALINIIDCEKVNVIAKSVGTKVFMKMLPEVEDRIHKVILCGIPVDPVGYLGGINKLGESRLMIFQNSHDPFMPYSIVSAFVKFINRKIVVVKKESETHDYPYFEDFLKFLE